MSLLDKTFENDLGTTTFREYFKELLCTLMTEKEGFSGKRPFGNSDWEFDLYKGLIQYNPDLGVLDEYGDVESLNEPECNRAILYLIAELCVGDN